MARYPRSRWSMRRRDAVDGAAPRPLGCFWPVFWLILLIVLLGLLFGGYRKGQKVSAPAPSPVRLSASAAGPVSALDRPAPSRPGSS